MAAPFPPSLLLPFLLLLSLLHPSTPTPTGADSWAFVQTIDMPSWGDFPPTPPSSFGPAFGRSIAISGDGSTLLIAEPRRYVRGTSSRGNVHAYCSDDAGAGPGPIMGRWTYIGNITSPGSPTTYGASLAVSYDGLTAFVGASGGFTGSVFAWSRASTSVNFDYQGSFSFSGGGGVGGALSCNTDCSVLAVGGFSTSGGGAAWICTPAPGAPLPWAPPSCTRLPTPWTTPVASYFGFGIALSGDGQTVAVGAPGDFSTLGRSFAFVRRGSTWVPSELAPTCGTAVGQNANYGDKLAISADGRTVLVGSPRGGAIEGFTVHFERNSSSDTFVCVQQLALGTTYDTFGASVSLNPEGTLALITASGLLKPAGIFFNRTGFGARFSRMPIRIPLPDTVPVNNMVFGKAAAMDAAGALAVVGAPGTDSSAKNGTAFAFTTGVRAGQPTASASATATATASASASGTATSSVSATATASSTATSTSSTSATASATSSASPSATSTATVGSSASVTPTQTPTGSVTPSPSVSSNGTSPGGDGNAAGGGAGDAPGLSTGAAVGVAVVAVGVVGVGAALMIARGNSAFRAGIRRSMRPASSLSPGVKRTGGSPLSFGAGGEAALRRADSLQRTARPGSAAAAAAAKAAAAAAAAAAAGGGGAGAGAGAGGGGEPTLLTSPFVGAAASGPWGKAGGAGKGGLSIKQPMREGGRGEANAFAPVGVLGGTAV
jgi:hypothetical protein